MQAVYSYSPAATAATAASPAAAPSAVATKAELAYAALKQIIDKQIAAHCERLTRGVSLQPGPNVKSIVACDNGTTVARYVLQIRSDQVLQFALNDIDTRIAGLGASEKATYNNLLTDLVARIQRSSGISDIIFLCEPTANKNLFNSKLVKSLAFSAK